MFRTKTTISSDDIIRNEPRQHEPKFRCRRTGHRYVDLDISAVDLLNSNWPIENKDVGAPGVDLHISIYLSHVLIEFDQNLYSPSTNTDCPLLHFLRKIA